jgi:hypothetical protein
MRRTGCARATIKLFALDPLTRPDQAFTITGLA